MPSAVLVTIAGPPAVPFLAVALLLFAWPATELLGMALAYGLMTIWIGLSLDDPAAVAWILGGAGISLMAVVLALRGGVGPAA